MENEVHGQKGLWTAIVDGLHTQRGAIGKSESCIQGRELWDLARADECVLAHIIYRIIWMV